MEKFRRTLLMWNEIPIYMTIPRLHKCRKCKEEKRQFIGHVENGAESVVKKQKKLHLTIRNPSKPTAAMMKPQMYSLKSRTSISTKYKNQLIQHQTIITFKKQYTINIQQLKLKTKMAWMKTSSSDDNNEDSTPEETSEWQQVTSGKKRKRKKFNHEQTFGIHFYKSTQEKTTCTPKH